jgi:hypothetical protein
MKRQFTLRDLFWLVAILAVGAAAWLDHRYMDQQLTFCKAELAEVEQQLEQTDADSSEQIATLQRRASDAERAAGHARQQAAIYAEEAARAAK